MAASDSLLQLCGWWALCTTLLLLVLVGKGRVEVEDLTSLTLLLLSLVIDLYGVWRASNPWRAARLMTNQIFGVQRALTFTFTCPLSISSLHKRAQKQLSSFLFISPRPRPFFPLTIPSRRFFLLYTADRLSYFNEANPFIR